MNETYILGLSGPAGCGKDTVADLLVAHAGFTKMAFADPLKSEVCNAFGIDLLHLNQRETKEHPMTALALRKCRDDAFIGRMLTGQTHCTFGEFLEAPRSPRWIMQKWGTEYRRHQDANYWVRLTSKRISYTLRERLATRIILTDCRFGNEVSLVCRTFGGQLWQIHRDGVEVAQDSHTSETTGAAFRPDLTLNNSQGISHLQERVLEAFWAHGAGLKRGSLQVKIGAPSGQAAA